MSNRFYSAFEIVYSLVFVGSLMVYVADVLLELSSGLNETATYRLGISALLSMQLIRMYWYLHEFEIEIDEPGPRHFLETVSDNCRKSEQCLRILMAVILVTATKIKLPVDGRELAPSLALVVCFGTLLIWDRIVWTDLSGGDPLTICADDDDAPNPHQDRWAAWQRAKAFFYLEKNVVQPTEMGHYWRSLKFKERTFGLLAAMAALLYTRWPLTALLLTALILFGAFCSAWLFGVMRIAGTEAEETSRRMAAKLLVAPMIPIFAIFDILRGETRMLIERSRKEIFGAGTLLSMVFVIILGLQGCGGREDSSPDDEQGGSGSESGEVVRIATSRNVWCALTLVSDARGYFEAEGLDARLTYQAAGRLNLDAVIGGAADIANVVETNIAYQAFNPTVDLQVRSRIVTAYDLTILTREDARITNPSDFRSARIAYAQATGAESFLFWFLDRHSLDDQVTRVPLQPAGVVDHFIGGGTEAVVTWEPFVSAIRSRPIDLGSSFVSSDTAFVGVMLVATRGAWANEHPAALAAYDRAMERASAFIADSTAGAQEIVSEQTGLPLETVEEIWNRFDFSYVPISEMEIALTEAVVRRIDRFVDMGNREPVDVREYFTDPLP